MQYQQIGRELTKTTLTSHSGPRPQSWWEEEAHIGEAMLQYYGSLGIWALDLEPETSNSLLTPSSSEKQLGKCVEDQTQSRSTQQKKEKEKEKEKVMWPMYIAYGIPTHICKVSSM
jgi:hypothetical protein